MAVIDISAMPPGEVPRIMVAGCSPVAQASSQATPAHTTSMASVPTVTEPSQRGAVCRNSRLKRTPRLTAITSCAAFDIHPGTADSDSPATVKAIATSSAPMNHGLVRPSARIAKPPAPVATASSARPPGFTSRALGGLISRPCSPLHCIANGIVTVTISTRRLWAAATRSVRAPWASASSVISEAPPIAPAK